MRPQDVREILDEREIQEMGKYEKLIDRNSITPADAGAISLIRGLPQSDRVGCYEKVKNNLSEPVRRFIELRVLGI